jgi:type IX secretion system PorP/SprF family membrane protein
MKKVLYISGILATMATSGVTAQDLHFSQYFNAPWLMNPANTALMPDADFRLGVNYRTQWGSIPAPYRTMDAAADVTLFRNYEGTSSFGMGMAFFSDKAGDGNLGTNNIQLSAAYHLALNDYNMLSFGVSGAYVTRSIDFSKLKFASQWNETMYDITLPNGEPNQHNKTQYFDVHAGLNYAFIPSEMFYLRLGLGMRHLNAPVASFINSAAKIGVRPSFNAEAMGKLGNNWIINPSLYVTGQSGATELIAGTMLALNLTPSANNESNYQMLWGIYYRLNDAVIGALGYQGAGFKIVASYDFNASSLAAASTKGNSAFEVSLIYSGRYPKNAGRTQYFHCPRF